mgnify:CR=1 FL=1
MSSLIELKQITKVYRRGDVLTPVLHGVDLTVMTSELLSIVGTSGSGKSLLLNEIAAAYLGTGARVWIIDVGRSYERVCRTFGGSFIEFTESASLSLNPFPLVEDIDEAIKNPEPEVALAAERKSPESDEVRSFFADNLFKNK